MERFLFSARVTVVLGLLSTSSWAIHQPDCTDNRDGLLWLVDGMTKFDGHVEICYDPGNPGSMGGDRQWYPVSGDMNWNNDTAMAVCRNLGFSGIDTFSISDEEQNGVQCSGIESLAVQCRMQRTCSGAMVKCDPAQCRDGEIRLRNGSTPLEGRVEICFNHQWGTVQQNGWGKPEANVVCGQLGFSNTSANNTQAGHTVDGTGPIYLSGLLCTGNEDRLTDCEVSPDVDKDDFRHSLDAGVECAPASCIDGDIRLTGRTRSIPTNTYGRVEVCYNKRWNSICDDQWDNDDANVVCRQLGHSGEGAIAVRDSLLGEPTLDPILPISVHCVGNESTTMECYRTEDTRCSYLETAGVICQVVSDATSEPIVSDMTTVPVGSTERNTQSQSQNLVPAVIVLGVISATLIVALTVVIIVLFIVLMRPKWSKYETTKSRRHDTIERDVDNPVYGGTYDEVSQHGTYDEVPEQRTYEVPERSVQNEFYESIGN